MSKIIIAEQRDRHQLSEYGFTQDGALWLFISGHLPRAS